MARVPESARSLSACARACGAGAARRRPIGPSALLTEGARSADEERLEGWGASGLAATAPRPVGAPRPGRASPVAARRHAPRRSPRHGRADVAAAARAVILVGLADWRYNARGPTGGLAGQGAGDDSNRSKVLDCGRLRGA